MPLISLFMRLVRKEADKAMNAVLRDQGGTSTLVSANIPGTRDYALVEAEQAGLVARTARLGRINAVGYGTIYDFALTAHGEWARRRLILADTKNL